MLVVAGPSCLQVGFVLEIDTLGSDEQSSCVLRYCQDIQ